MSDQLAEIEARHQAATPGPYRWRGNAANYNVHLRTTWGGGYWVMGFKRWGMRDAEPTLAGSRVQPETEGERALRHIETPFAWEPDTVDLDYDRRMRNGYGSDTTRARPLNDERKKETGRPIITPAHHYFRYEVGYRHDIVGIAHPDAIALERSWEDRDWLIAEVKRLRAALAQGCQP